MENGSFRLSCSARSISIDGICGNWSYGRNYLAKHSFSASILCEKLTAIECICNQAFSDFHFQQKLNFLFQLHSEAYAKYEKLSLCLCICKGV